jgi:hypothetical protein
MKKIVSKKEVLKHFATYSNQFAVISNPKNIFPEYEICPLAQKAKYAVKFPIASVMDMDGTTTTTEELCLHSLEFAIRKMSGLISVKEWKGLDHQIDYPHIIGNSTTKHVEYLVSSYSNSFNPNWIKSSFVYAALWTILFGVDKKRKQEVEINLKHFGIGDLLSLASVKKIKIEKDLMKAVTNILNKNYFTANKFTNQDYVKIAIDVYYQRYHEILKRIKYGESENVANEIFGSASKRLIEPMPGVLLFLAIIKGWLGKDVEHVLDLIINEYRIKSGKEFRCRSKAELISRIINLSKYCEKKPLKVALVTSSIRYEAEIVMNEVFNVLRKNIASLPLTQSKKELLLNKFSDFKNVYDAFITASDSNEIRLKPHRDLYSIALQQMSIHQNNFNSVIGFEDSESGTIAMRAAGINLAVALPFAQTKGHNLTAASFICNGGLAEVILKHKFFVK